MVYRLADPPHHRDVFVRLPGGQLQVDQGWHDWFLNLARRIRRIENELASDAKYQLSCSDLTSDLQVATDVAYFHVQKAFTPTEARASLLVASTSGAVTITMTLDGAALLSTPLTIDANETSSVTAATPEAFAITRIPDDSRIRIDITGAGTGAKGLICSVLGTTTLA